MLILLSEIENELIAVIQDKDNVGNVKQKLAKLFDVSLKATFPSGPTVEPMVAASTSKFGDYQWYAVTLSLKMHELK